MTTATAAAGFMGTLRYAIIQEQNVEQTEVKAVCMYLGFRTLPCSIVTFSTHKNTMFLGKTWQYRDMVIFTGTAMEQATCRSSIFSLNTSTAALIEYPREISKTSNNSTSLLPYSGVALQLINLLTIEK